MLRVNDQIGTLESYRERRLARIEWISQAQGVAEAERRQAIDEAGKVAMRELFEELLLLSRAQQLRVTASREQLDRAVASTRKRFGLENQEEFERALAQSGLTLPLLRARLERQLITQEVIGRELQPRIKIDDEVLLKAYRQAAEEFRVPERVQVRELVVLTAARPTASERLELARAIRAEIAGGKDLADVAAKYQGQNLTSGVVDLGWVTKGELDPALEAAVWGLASGALSEPVEARGGLHLVELRAREETRLRPFAEVKEALAERERARRFDSELRKYLDELAAKAYVRDDPPAEAVGYRAAIAPAEEAIAPLAAPPAVSPSAAPTPTPAPTDRP